MTSLVENLAFRILWFFRINLHISWKRDFVDGSSKDTSVDAEYFETQFCKPENDKVISK